VPFHAHGGKTRSIDSRVALPSRGKLSMPKRLWSLDRGVIRTGLHGIAVHFLQKHGQSAESGYRLFYKIKQ
jgi:hypothetical protein